MIREALRNIIRDIDFCAPREVKKYVDPMICTSLSILAIFDPVTRESMAQSAFDYASEEGRIPPYVQRTGWVLGKLRDRRIIKSMHEGLAEYYKNQHKH